MGSSELFQKSTILDKDCMQILQAKQHRFYYSMSYCWFFLQYFIKTCQNLAFGWSARCSSLNPSVLKIFLKFPNSLRSSVLSDLATREAFSGDNNLVPFHLWWRKIMLKHGKVCKRFIQDGRNNHGEVFPWKFLM